MNTHKQTNTRTDRRTFQLIENIGPEGRCFKSPTNGITRFHWVSQQLIITLPFIFFFNYFIYHALFIPLFVALVPFFRTLYWIFLYQKLVHHPCHCHCSSYILKVVYFLNSLTFRTWLKETLDPSVKSFLLFCISPRVTWKINLVGFIVIKLAPLIKDPPPSSFTLLVRKWRKKKKRILTQDMWHMTCYKKHMTYDLWHMVGDLIIL